MRIGRLGRLGYFIGLFIGPALFALAYFGLGPQSVLIGIVSVLWLVWLFLLFIGRLHDLNYNAWWGVALAFCCGAPGVNAIILLVLCAKLGDKNANRYGLPPSGSLKDLLYFWRAKSEPVPVQS
jgi:uncharacterized membrane protein YhaH (DUF805 family)